MCSYSEFYRPRDEPCPDSFELRIRHAARFLRQHRCLGRIRPNISMQATYYIDDPSKQGQWGGAMAIGFSLGRR